MADLTLNIQLPLKHFTLSVNTALPVSGITAIFGASGAGKTSLLRAISGLEKSTQGLISFNDKTWLNTANNTNIKVYQRNLGLVFQDNRLFDHLTVEKNLQYALSRRKQQQFNYQDVIRLTNITALLSQYPATLSGGEQQRVAIARALLNEPELLLLDEPFSALDMRNKANLISLLHQVNKQFQLPILYVSHSLDDIQQLAVHLLVLSQGKISHLGHTAQVIHQLNYGDNIQQQTSLKLAIDQTLSEQLAPYGLMALSFADNTSPAAKLYLSTPRFELNKQATLSCYISADDISICLTENQHSSIVNQLAGVIDEITILGKKALIKVICHQQEFYVMISLYSLEKLQLNNYLDHSQARHVYIQFKASSVKTLNDSIES